IRDLESAESRGTNSMTTTNSFEYTWTWYNTLTYNFDINDDNRFNIILGSEAIKNNYETFSGSRSRFSVDDLWFLSAFTKPGQCFQDGRKRTSVSRYFQRHRCDQRPGD